MILGNFDIKNNIITISSEYAKVLGKDLIRGSEEAEDHHMSSAVTIYDKNNSSDQPMIIFNIVKKNHRKY